jgi:hypothetical protein
MRTKISLIDADIWIRGWIWCNSWNVVERTIGFD